MALRMHFGSAKGEGHVNVYPPSYTLNNINCIAGEPNGLSYLILCQRLVYLTSFYFSIGIKVVAFPFPIPWFPGSGMLRPLSRVF